MGFMSTADEEKIASLQAQWQAQKAAGADDGVLNAIHQQAENIRANYGYSGGTAGNEYIPLSNTSAKAQSAYTTTSSQNDYINQLYAAKQAQALANLKSAYEQNVATLDTQKAKIPETYNTARNQTASTYNQNLAGFNERAAASGINSGAGSQAALSMANTYAGNMNTLNKEEAQSLSDIENQRAQLSTQYQNAIQSAIASNELAKAQALYDEAVRVDNQLLSQQQYNTELQMSQDNTTYNRNLAMAQTLAQFGDFSGYKALGYTDAQIAAMQAYWNAQNSGTTTAKVSGYSGSGGGKSTSDTETSLTAQNQNTGLFGNAVTLVDNPSTISALYSALSKIEDKGTAVRSNVMQTVKNYLNSGLISETTAAKILANYGI